MLTIILLLTLQKVLVKIRRKRNTEPLHLKSSRYPVSMIGVILIVFLAFRTGHAQPGELVYDVVKKRSVIGTIVTTQTMENEEVRYRIDSKVSVPILITRHRIELHQTGIYKNDMLISGLLIKRVNGKEKTRNQIVRKNDTYQVSTKERSTYELQSGIYYSVAGLYFNEPVNTTRIYSENFLQFLPVKKVSTHRYRISFPDGTVNHYTYDNGICVLAEIDAGITSVQFILRSKIYTHASLQ